jgi:ribonuclease E
MLIDATHPEETRVVVLSGNRLEEFDHEFQSKKQLKGNIYLAKVIRVEPSLQACFVEYGGNRHGFLAFGEIHPDYYRIPIADREALLAEAAAQRDEETEDGVETLGGDDLEEVRPRRRQPSRSYKIQEVIQRRQIMLVQVVKEERGTKGAALTTFLSLAGRYCVLMPNTPRGGGVSRKITSATDRKRLKSILDELELPDGMAVIVRTAGLDRPKTEIKRDYEYLIRLWSEIRDTTLASVAPALIHEEGNLITRAIRDLYSREIEEVLVDGEEGYKTAKALMRTIMPSHAKRVQPYKDVTIPMFHRFQVEDQLDAIHSPTVQLRSGGYIVINATEALIAIDVNSGKSTRERHIEETAFKTNLEAADEVARQVRLRDLAGLIVVDFIDMEDGRNDGAVEKRLKEAMRHDRARIQIGKISAFGLLEMSRQRLRPSVLELTTERCPHCNGTGVIRSTESTALYVLRAIEEEAIRGKAAEITVHVPTGVALYVLNQKRAMLIDIEQRYQMRISLGADDSLIPPDMRIERTRLRDPDEPVVIAPRAVPIAIADDEPDASVDPAEDEDREATDGAPRADDDGAGRKRRRRRRKRRGGERMDGAGDEQASADGEEADDSEPDGDDQPNASQATPRDAASDEDANQRRRRRRGRRGGRRRSEDAVSGAEGLEVRGEVETVEIVDLAALDAEPEVVEVAAEPEAPVKPKRTRRKKAEVEAPDPAPAQLVEPDPTPEIVAAEEPTPPAKPKRAPRRKAAVSAEPTVAEAPVVETPVVDEPEPVVVAPEPTPPPAANDEQRYISSAPIQVISLDEAPPPEKRRGGWWSKR